MRVEGRGGGEGGHLLDRDELREEEERLEEDELRARLRRSRDGLRERRPRLPRRPRDGLRERRPRSRDELRERRLRLAGPPRTGEAALDAWRLLPCDVD